MRFTLNQIMPWTDDFSFLSTDNEMLVVCNPQDSICESPVYQRSKKSLEEHILFINEKQIKKALVVGDNIDFLRSCPSLEELHIIPSFDAQDFDFSPLYDLPNLRKLICQTVYGPEEDRISYVDYSKFSSLKDLVVNGTGHNNVDILPGLKVLTFSGKQPASKTLVGSFQGADLEDLGIIESPIFSLVGLEQASKLKKMILAYNRNLEDISALECVRETLTELDIESCGRIKDFSVLEKLHKLENLRLIGRNVLPNLSFIRQMPSLKSFTFYMNAADGDLSMCLDIPFVQIQNRRHYTHKNEDFKKR